MSWFEEKISSLQDNMVKKVGIIDMIRQRDVEEFKRGLLEDKKYNLKDLNGVIFNEVRLFQWFQSVGTTSLNF
jgi:hypothetical protein